MSQDLAKYIDHTLLSPQATKADITKLCAEAAKHKFFAVCVNPHWVRHAAKELANSDVAVATVIGFPLGANLTDIKIAEAQRAISEGAEELDLVINIGALKSGDIELVEQEIKAIVKLAGDRMVKVIIETDLLTDDEKVAVTKACARAQVGMVKTSTGMVKDGKGATVEDVKLIRETLGDAKIGIKASGGVRNAEHAKAMIEAGAARLGTSAGIAIVSGAAEPAKAAY